jgi:hypothetical protein
LLFVFSFFNSLHELHWKMSLTFLFSTFWWNYLIKRKLVSTYFLIRPNPTMAYSQTTKRNHHIWDIKQNCWKI